MAQKRIIPEYWPNGHFYSPVPDIDSVEEDAARIFRDTAPPLPDIDLRIEHQHEVLAEMATTLSALEKPLFERYNQENSAYTIVDATILFLMLYKVKPKHIIEVGCGYSSCALIDYCSRNSHVQCTCIDPHPQQLLSLLKPGDSDTLHIVPQRVQDIDLELFRSLSAGDVLFIDSSHVAKAGSDVCHFLKHVFPILNPGVFVHIHDIYYPFEYPKEWIQMGRCWNETYMIHALLSCNTSFQIELFVHFMQRHQANTMQFFNFPEGKHGSSLWLQRTQ